MRHFELDRDQRLRLRRELSHWRAKRGQPLAGYTRAFVKHFGAQVRSGPFAGMRYTRRGVAMAEDVVAKLLGSYEQELADVLEAAIALQPPVIVNIGAGEGYYAVGLALRCPTAEVVAFETDELRRLWCTKMAGANGVGDRVAVRGHCGVADLEQALRGRPSLVLCDCEGSEAEILVPSSAPSLAQAMVVVEVHDFVSESIAPGLESSLAATHDLTWIEAGRRWRDDHPELAMVPGSDYMEQDLAINEFRPSLMRWLVARPKVQAAVA